jgi:hypothetical protein
LIGAVGNINITAAETIRAVAAGKYQPRSILRNNLSAFVLLGVDAAGKAAGGLPAGFAHDHSKKSLR